MIFQPFEKKIQVKDDNNDVSIGKKFDKYSELERKEAYEKASLDNEESKDKQDIFLENNSKYVDDIIKEMTPKTLTQEQMKFLEIHNQTNHCMPTKEIQVMASMGIFDSKFESCQPPACASCMLGCAHKKPWRVKRK